MKKILALSLALIMGFAATGCQNPSGNEPSPVPPSSVATPQPEKSMFDGVEWAAEYDVVVIGYGGAGASAAISAADEGSKVLVVEKAPEGAEGGNTKLSGQQILSPTDVETALTYFDTIFGGYSYDADLVRAMVEGMNELKPWLEYLGAKNIGEITYPEFPEVAGSETMRCYLIDNERSTGKLWATLDSAVKSRTSNIDVWYSSPAKELIQDYDTATITGVQVERDGVLLNVKALNGVVMACGGYENNQDMIQNYLHLEYAYPKGTPYNTGDGIVMAMKAGADLWHMNNPAGPDLNFKAPDSNAYYGYSLAMSLGSKSTIFVGPDGTRFINESLMTRHGKMPTHGTYQTAVTALPAYAVFDEAVFTAGPIITSGGWSSDNVAELEKGWLVKADTLEELAATIGVSPENLAATVGTYNGYCAGGNDTAFARAAKTLIPISGKGPYYAMELTPTLTNTQGGAVRNANCEVVDLDGYAIPHLYSAGEFGSMFVHGYNGGGNVGEALVSGSIAGKNAATADKALIPVISNGKLATQESTKSEQNAVPENLSFVAGVYTGTGHGMADDIIVEVTVTGDSITSVVITTVNDTPTISDGAVEKMPDRIVTAQSTKVDVVAGATMTSNGILDAVEDALTQAKK